MMVDGGTHGRIAVVSRYTASLGHRLLLIALCCAAWAAALDEARAEPAERYDCVDDFSFTSNPSGTWTYGWAENLDAPFQPYPESIHDPSGVDLWVIEEFKQPLLAALPLKMQDLDDFPPLLLLQTGHRGEYSVLRWTAPRDGWITLQVLYAGLFDADVLDKTPTDKTRRLRTALPRPANPARLAVLENPRLEDLIDRDLHVWFNGSAVLDGTIPDLPPEAAARLAGRPRSFLQGRLTSLRRTPPLDKKEEELEPERLGAKRRYLVRRGDTLDFVAGQAPNSAYLKELVGVHVGIQYHRYGVELWGYESLLFGQSPFLPFAYARLGGGLGFPSWLGRALTLPAAANSALVASNSPGSATASPPGSVGEVGTGDIPPETGPGPHSAPEPSSLALLGLGAGFLFGFAWRRDRRSTPGTQV